MQAASQRMRTSWRKYPRAREDDTSRSIFVRGPLAASGPVPSPCSCRAIASRFPLPPGPPLCDIGTREEILRVPGIVASGTTQNADLDQIGTRCSDPLTHVSSLRQADARPRDSCPICVAFIVESDASQRNREPLRSSPLVVHPRAGGVNGFDFLIAAFALPQLCSGRSDWVTQLCTDVHSEARVRQTDARHRRTRTRGPRC